MADLCDDGRFELIEKYKLMLIESTNIIDSKDELNVLDTILFRFWQMGWLDKLEQPTAQQWIPCSERLPKTHETGNSFSGIYMQSSPVLVYGVPEYEEEYGFHVVTYCDDKNGCTYWSTELDAVTINEVYAWMPLPEPWKGEQNE